MPDTPSSISAEQVRRVAKLARLSPTDEQIERYRADLSAIIGYVDRLRTVDIQGVEPLANPVEETNRLRDDVPGPTLPAAALTQMAPKSSGPFVQVPRVLGGED